VPVHTVKRRRKTTVLEQLLEVSGPSSTASNTLRPKRLHIRMGSVGAPVQTFVLRRRPKQTEPNRTEPQWLWMCGQ
jgi:hypothetical protein